MTKNVAVEIPNSHLSTLRTELFVWFGKLEFLTHHRNFDTFVWLPLHAREISRISLTSLPLTTSPGMVVNTWAWAIKAWGNSSACRAMEISVCLICSLRETFCFHTLQFAETCSLLMMSVINSPGANKGILRRNSAATYSMTVTFYETYIWKNS